MSLVNIEQTCYLCHGDGELGNIVPRTCGRCGGSGTEIIATLDLTQLETKLKNKLESIRDEIIDAITGA